MNRNVRVLSLLVLLIIIPFLIYAFLQLSSLKDDEQMADEIYEKQMDAILFSLNQYADDMMEQWVNDLEDEENPVFANAEALLLGNESVQMIVLHEVADKTNTFYFNEYVVADSVEEELVSAWYTNHDSLLSQLEDYLAAGFQKIQSAEDWQPLSGLRPSQAATSFMLYDRDSVLYNCLVILEASYWAEQILASRMVELARDNFNLAVMETTMTTAEPTILYSTFEWRQQADYFERPLWILPNTTLAIRPQGETYSELIRNRNRQNFYFLAISVIIVLFGGFLIIRNIRNMVKLAQLKSDFVSNVSHEIRTPISLIRMYAETLMLGRVKAEEKKQHYYDVIHHESGRLTYLVNNILDFSRIEANRKVYSKEPLNLNPLVEKIYNNYAYTFKEKNVLASLHLAPAAINVELDPAAFDEALSNLVDNAIKYSKDEILIEITTGTHHGYGYCQVKDTGRGISKAEQDKIFDKFYRVEGAMTQETKGTGLGLSLVKHIMEAHQGKIEVNSSPGQGSTFTLKFPLTKH